MSEETATPYVTITEPDSGGAWVECPNCDHGMVMGHFEEWPCNTCDGTGVIWQEDDEGEDEDDED